MVGQPVESKISCGHVSELESFRGLLAMWVVFSHIMIPNAPKLNGDNAVSLFMMLSGFVICILLYKNKEKYLKYIYRRFLRLFPLFIFSFIFSVAFVDVFISSIDIYPWSGSKEVVRRLVFEESKQEIWKHIIVHATMLHGVIPRDILPNAPYAYLGPAWSISLEWQFYIVAPLIIYSFKRLLPFTIMLGIFIFLDEKSTMGVSYLPESLHFFLIGVMSFYFIFGEKNNKWIYLLKIGLLLGFTLFQSRHDFYQLWPVITWLIVIESVFSNKLGHTLPWVRYVLQMKYIRYLGRISYSLYLIHLPIIYLMSYFLVSIGLDFDPYLYTVVYVPSMLVVVLLIAHLTYNFIEKPFINLGKATKVR